MNDSKHLVATEFLSKLREQVPTFLKNIELTLMVEYNLDVSDFEADHICWRTSTAEEYTELVTHLKQCSDIELLVESVIGGRLIATFQLKYSIPVQRFYDVKTTTKTNNNDKESSYFRYIDTIEIPSPKMTSQYKSGLEHVEFVIPASITMSALSNSNSSSLVTPLNDMHHQSTFEDFMTVHSNVPWNIKAMQKEVNPG
jgi:predicted metalloenzyme YecM